LSESLYTTETNLIVYYTYSWTQLYFS